MDTDLKLLEDEGSLTGQMYFRNLPTEFPGELKVNLLNDSGMVLATVLTDTVGMLDRKSVV